MSDLISREALRDIYFEKCNRECCTCIERDDESGDCGLIRYAPAVDAVEVVRCKDCLHWIDGVCGNFSNEDGSTYFTPAHGYCYAAEKADDE